MANRRRTLAFRSGHGLVIHIDEVLGPLWHRGDLERHMESACFSCTRHHETEVRGEVSNGFWSHSMRFSESNGSGWTYFLLKQELRGPPKLHVKKDRQAGLGGSSYPL